MESLKGNKFLAHIERELNKNTPRIIVKTSKAENLNSQLDLKTLSAVKMHYRRIASTGSGGRAVKEHADAYLLWRFSILFLQK